MTNLDFSRACTELGIAGDRDRFWRFVRQTLRMDDKLYPFIRWDMLALVFDEFRQWCAELWDGLTLEQEAVKWDQYTRGQDYRGDRENVYEAAVQ